MDQWEMSWFRCSEVPDWIVSFENVITISVDSGVKYTFGITSDFQTGDHLKNSPVII